MGKQNHASRFRPKRRFVRSVHIERDFGDLEALKDYVVTTASEQALNRILSGLAPGSAQRAWRLTGDYGCGKSALALALAHVVSADKNRLPTQLRSFSKGRVSRMHAVLLTGSRTPMTEALLRRLVANFEELGYRGPGPRFVRDARTIIQKDQFVEDEFVVDFIRAYRSYLVKKKVAAGVCIVIDELGKYLEYAVLHPDQQDVYLLQMLAEEASRSAGDSPLILIGVLHQGFGSYAAKTSVHQQKEWEKVAGRYEEIVFQPSLDQSLALAGSALRTQTEDLSAKLKKQLSSELSKVRQLGWYGGTEPGLDEFLDLYPVHPSTFPVLVRFFQRYGQNERSLFSFLLSSQPFSLQTFAAQTSKTTDLYRISDLYDYIKANIGYRLQQMAGSRWAELEAIVEAYVQRRGDVELRVLKTVAVLNLLDNQGLLALEDVLILAVADPAAQVKRALKTLIELRLLYARGKAGGYCLWPYTSIDILDRYTRAEEALGSVKEIARLTEQFVETRPIVARRHYIETGNLRYFNVRYVPTRQLQTALDTQAEGRADGYIIIALCENSEERIAAIDIISNYGEDHQADGRLLLAASPVLSPLAPSFHTYRCWAWVQKNVPELSQDKFAAQEVSRLVDESKEHLQEQMSEYLGLRHDMQMSLQWYWKGDAQEVVGRREFLALLSDICDEVYDQGPRIHNELVNRNQLSSAAAAARMRLIERMFSHPNEEFLGLDSERKPPEMSMYLSVLAATKLHQNKDREGWIFARPSKRSDRGGVLPALDAIASLLRSMEESRVPVPRVMKTLRQPPYGVRDGLLLLLLAVICAIDEHKIALYEEGSFVRKITGEHFARMFKFPDYYELQYFEISGVRSVLFQQLLDMLDPDRGSVEVNVLDVVRPLLSFAGQLPKYTLRTRRLSSETQAVRRALLKAREPTPLVFDALPRACGVEPFTGTMRKTTKNTARVETFLEVLRRALDELRAAYPELLTKLRSHVKRAFDADGSFSMVRQELASRAQTALTTVREPRLKGFCLRLADHILEEQPWLEALGSYVCSKPPKIWLDNDEARFADELTLLTERFLRAESLGFGAAASTAARSRAVRVSLTRVDGSHVDQVISASEPELSRAADLERALDDLLGNEQRRVRLVAISHLMWQAMELTTDD